MISKAIIFNSPFEVGMGEFELPDLQSGEILTKTILSGVSTGTETRVLSGKQDGASFPLVPGYENMGEIINIGENVNLKIGTKVFVGSSNFTGQYNKSWGAHLEYAICDENSVVPIPKDVRDEEAVFTKIGAISLHGVKRAKVKSNDQVVVVGLGLIGTLAALCCKAFGADVIGVDVNENRLKILENSGISNAINPSKNIISDEVKNIFGKGADVVIDATGNAKLADNSAKLLKDKDWDNIYHESGKLVLLGSCVDPVCFDYNDTLFMKEIDILPSRDTVTEDLVHMLQLINNGKVNVSAIPQEVYKYTHAKQAYDALLNKELMRMVIDWRSI